MQGARRAGSKPSRRFLMLGGGVVGVAIIVISAAALWPEESVDVAVVDPGLESTLANHTQPVSLGRRLILRNLLMGLAHLREEYKEWQKKLQASQRAHYDDLQKRLIDLKAVQGDRWEALRKGMREFQRRQEERQAQALEELRKHVEEAIHVAAEDQKKASEKEVEALQRLERAAAAREAAWEYERGFPRKQNYTPYTMTEDSLDQWEQRTFRHYGAYGFVKFSAYRVSRSRISVVGLAARSHHSSRRLTWCQWTASDGTALDGTLSMLFAGEHHNYMYEVVVLNCDLTRDLSDSGGFLRAKIDSEVMFLYRESSAQPLDVSERDIPFQLAYCGPPMRTELDARAVKEYVDYHFVYMGAEHSVFYDAGAVTGDMLSLLRPYLANGVLAITDFRAVSMWEVWQYGQVLAANDCAYRMRGTARWAFMQDFDEYFEVVPLQTVSQLLHAHGDVPWLSYGCLVFSIHHCLGNDTKLSSSGIGSSLLVSPMVFRWPHPYCKDPSEKNPALCLGQPGQRRYIINPRKVSLLRTFEVVEWEGTGVDLSTKEARLLNFEGLGKRGQELCDKDPPLSWWLQYEGVTRISQAISSCRRDPKTMLCKPGSVEDLEKIRPRRVEDASDSQGQDKAGKKRKLL